MLSTAIGIQFDVNDLKANYEVIGSSDNYSFQYNLGKGSKLVDFEGETAQKTISLNGNYGIFSIRIFAVSDVGIRSEFLEEKISISPPLFDDTFTFSEIKVSNLPEDSNIGSTIEIEPSETGNLLAVNSEYINRNVEIEWRLSPPPGHAKEGRSLGNELLSDKLLRDFSLQIRNTENGDVISDTQLNSSVALQSTLNTASVSDMMDAYTGFSFIVSNDTITELNLDRTLALEVVSNDAFGRQATGVLTGINYLPTVDSLSYNLRGAKMSFSWSSQDTDFYAAQISSLAIPGDEEIYDPYNLQQSIDHYESLSRAPIWEKHNNYRVGDKVVRNSIVFECIQNYIYSSFPNINTSDTSYWTNIGPVIDHSFTQEDVTQNNKEFNQIWGYNYYYSFVPIDGYGTGVRTNLTETGLHPGGALAYFKSDVKIDNLNFIERGDDLIFRWNITDQDNNLVDLNQYKFLVGATDKPTILGISGSLYDSDTNSFLTGITEGLNSRTSVTENGVENISEDLPGTKVFETYEYTRAINNSIYKVGGFPENEGFSFSGQYNNGDHVIFDNSLYRATSETASNSFRLTTPSIGFWDSSTNYLFRNGLNCSDLFTYQSGVYSVVGSANNEIIGPDAGDVLGLYNELQNYSVGDLVISPNGNTEIYNGGKFFDVGDSVLHEGSLYTCITQQAVSDYISPGTGINHWRSASAFSDVPADIYKAINAVPQSSEILPSTGSSHWQIQNPETSNKYSLLAENYDFPIRNWSQFDDFSSLDFVVYANDIWSGIDSSGPNTPAGAKVPSLSNSSYWTNTDSQSNNFSTSHQIGDKVFSNGAIYKCLANNPIGAPLEAVVDSSSQINSSYQASQWIPYWELNTGFDDRIFKHEGIPESGKRSVGLELAILSPLGQILNSRKIVGNNPEPSILPQGFQVDSLSNVTQVHFNFNYAYGSREQTTKLQLYRSSDPVFSILDSNGFPGSGAGSFISEILGPGDSTFGENITSVTDSPPIPNVPGLGHQITGYYYKLLPFDSFGSGDLFNVTDNQGDLERVLVYPHGYNNQNENGYMGPVFSTTEDAIPGPVKDFKGDTAFRNYFLNWKMPDAEFDSVNNIINTSPNDISHYEVWESEDNYLYFGTEDTTLDETRNLSGYRRITGDLTSVGPIPTEINDPALGITNATNVLNISAISPSVQITHQGEPNDKRYFWVRPVDHAGNKGPFTGDANLGSSNDIIGLNLTLGQARTTDVSDFEQNITQTFPNTLALVPNNPFTANQPYGGEVAWDRHFVYSDGVGYVIGHNDTYGLKTSQGLSTAKYIYWKRSDMSALTAEQYSMLGLAPPGDKAVRLIHAEIDGAQNISRSQFSIKETYYDLGVANQYNNHYIRFKNGLLDTQERKISNYQKFANYATITLERSFSQAPLNGDDIEILEEVSVSSAITNPLRSIQFSGQYRVSDYHPAGEGETSDPSAYAGPDMDSEKPSLLDDNDFIIARNAGGIPTPMWHAFANATIGTAHIEEAAITNAKIHNLTADKIRSSVIQSQDIQVGGDGNSGQIRSAGFGLLNNSGTRGYDCVDAPGAGFAISGNGSFIFKTERGKLFFEKDELTIHGNIRQKDGSELTVMSMNAEPAVFNYDETADGVFDPELLQTSNITVRFNNSDITASDVRFKMELPDGTNIFNYTDYSNGYNAYGFEYQPSNTYFNSDTKVATATFKVGDRKTNAAGFDKIIHGTDDVIDFQSVIIYASGIGTSTEHSTTVSMLANGAAGPTGKTPVYRGVWSASANYIGMEDGNQGSDTAEELRGDLVYYDNSSSPAGANGHHYIAMKNSGPSSLVVAPGTHAQTDDYWKKFGAEFQSVATNLLLADNAVITHSLTMGSSDDDNPATHGAGGKIVSSQFLGGFNDALTDYRISEDYSKAGFRLQKSATSPYNVALDVGGSSSYFRYSSITDRVEIKGSFINNTVAENINFTAVTATDSQATFIGGGYNNEIHEDPNNAYDSLGSSIVGGAYNDITGRFSFIGNGYNNSVGDNFSAIVAGYNNSMPDIEISNEGANIIGAGIDNKIDGGSAQCILAGDKNIISYDKTDTTHLTNAGLINFELSYLNKNILGDGVNSVALTFNNTWAISSSWFPARKDGTTLTNWDSAFYVGALISSIGNKYNGGQGWVYDVNFGWVYLGGPSGRHNLYLSTRANPAKAMFAWAPDLTGVGASSWKLFFESRIYTNHWAFQSSYISNPTLIGTWQDGEGIIVYEENSSPPWFGLIRNSSGVIFSSPIPNPYVNPLTYSDTSPPITPIVGDIDGDGTPDASDSTPAIRLRGTRQSNGSIVWFVYVIFTNTSLTHAKIHVSGGAAFAGSLQDSDTLSSQNSYKVGDFTANNISSAVNGYTNYAYFRFPVSSDNGSTYSNSQTIESIEVAIPTVGASSGDEASTYKHLYQSL